jgi:hypothetical protein
MESQLGMHVCICECKCVPVRAVCTCAFADARAVREPPIIRCCLSTPSAVLS